MPFVSPALRRRCLAVRCLAVFCLALLLAGAFAPLGLAGEAQDDLPAGAVHLVVLHTNDVHGQALPRPAAWAADGERRLGGLGRVAAYVRQVRAEHSGLRRGVLVVDGGDWFQGTPEGQLDGGAPFVEAMAAVGYDAMAVGNHEWDLGEANLRRVLRRSRAPAVLSNVRAAPQGARFDAAPPWRLVRAGGLRIAVVGLILPGTPFITHEDAGRYHFAAPEEELERVLAELPAAVDLVLPLTHLGLDADRRLAQAFPDLPLIVGGHSHSFLPDGVREGRTAIVQAGSKATVVGRVDLWIDPSDMRVLACEARLVELGEEPQGRWRNARVERLLAALTARVDKHMSEVVGKLLAEPVTGGGLTTSGLGNWISDAMARAADAPIAVHNRGGIRSTLSKGLVTRRQLFEVLPFDNTVVSLELSGAELEAMVRRSFEGERRRGFEFSGLELEVESLSGATRVLAVSHGGRALEPEGRYRLATNSFLAAGGDRLLEGLRPAGVRDTGILLRDALERELAAAGGLELPSENRIRVRADQGRRGRAQGAVGQGEGR